MKKKIVLIFFILIALTSCKSIQVKTYKDRFASALNKMDMQKSYQTNISMNILYEEQLITINTTQKHSMPNDEEGHIEACTVTNINGVKESGNTYTVIKSDNVSTYNYDVYNDKWKKDKTSLDEYYKDLSNFELFKNAKSKFLRKEKLENKYDCDVFSIGLDDTSFLNKILGESLEASDDFTPHLIDIKFEVYIDNSNSLIRRIYIDLTEAMKKYNKITSFDKYDITIDYTNFDNTQVDIPVDAIERIIKGITPPDPIEKNNSQTKYNFTGMFPQIPYDSTVIPLAFKIDDAVEHPSEPLLYFVCSNEKALYEVNYRTKDIRKVTFDLVPKRLTFGNGKVYVTLLNEQKGAIAIVNAHTMTLEKARDFNTEPFDIEVDNGRNFYISSVTDQRSIISSYNRNCEIIDAEYISDSSNITYNKYTDNIYCFDNASTFRNYEVFLSQKGEFTLNSIHYQKSFNLNNRCRISPDGRYIFNGSGVILNCSNKIQHNLIYKTKLTYGFDDIAFDLNRNSFYTSHGNQILLSNYYNYDIKGFFKSYGKIEFMFYKDDYVIAVGKDSIKNYYIELISIEKEPVKEKEEIVSIEDAVRIINVPVTDMTKHPTKNIYYFISSVDKALYEYDYEQNKVREVKFTLPPESLAYMNNKIYVTLTKGCHNPLWSNITQKGAFAIINATTMKIDKQIDINQDPFDIVVDKDGYVYITPGSGQPGSLIRYNPLGEPENEKLSFQGDYIIYNPHVNKIYTVSSELSTKNITAFLIDFSRQIFCSSELSNDFVSYINVSPDGAYIFNGSGDILKSSTNEYEEFKPVGKLKYGFDFIAFNNNVISASKDKTLYIYDYSTFELVETIPFKNTIKSLFYDSNKLYALTINDYGNYQIECE